MKERLLGVRGGRRESEVILTLSDRRGGADYVILMMIKDSEGGAWCDCSFGKSLAAFDFSALLSLNGFFDFLIILHFLNEPGVLDSVLHAWGLIGACSFV